MITAENIVKKLGKEKAVEFMVNNRPKEKTKAEKSRGIHGRIRYRMCEHGNYLIENYEPKHCPICSRVTNRLPAIIVHDKVYFNIGTGTYGTTTDHRKAAKFLGLQESG